MRLKCIKLAGFKSFVDPTTVSFPSNLCSVVGPNGCGKSNVIDAVRWVMGESSAKNLRGESMTDVIFNGSGGRKPVGQASVELVFDNSDHRLTGEYANFDEVSIKRKINRDAQSTYSLNGTKCRRRDITDILLGTGLGARSYSIIEQGMVSRLIESKPEELRVFIEEAAGISKYKERRRETENRIRRTKENLERLEDIRDELQRQLQHLQRQSTAAEKYGEFKQQERETTAQLNAIRWRALDSELAHNQEQINVLELKLEESMAQHREIDAKVEKHFADNSQYTDALGEVQAKFYGLGNEIARIEQSLEHHVERVDQLKLDLRETDEVWVLSREELDVDIEKVTQLEIDLDDVEPKLEAAEESELLSSDLLDEAEASMQHWQQEWDSFNQRAEEPRQTAEVEQSRIQQLEKVVERGIQSKQRLIDEQTKLGENPEDEAISDLAEEIAMLELSLEEQQDNSADLGETIELKRGQLQSCSSDLDNVRSDLQKAMGRQSSLEALQQAAMGRDNKAVNTWLDNNDLSDQQRLGDKIEVAPGWEKAVEAVLADSLQGVCIEGIDNIESLLSELPEGMLSLIDTSSSFTANDSTDRPTQLVELSDKLSADWSVNELLTGIFVAEDLAQALSARAQLSPAQSIVTRQGVCLGRTWIRVIDASDEKAGLLERKGALAELESNITQFQSRIDELLSQQDSCRSELSESEKQRQAIAQQIAQQSKQHGELKSQYSSHVAKVEQATARRNRIAHELVELNKQLEVEEENIGASRERLQIAIDSMEENVAAKEELENQRGQRREKLDQVRHNARRDKDLVHELKLKSQSSKTTLSAIKETMARMTGQVQRSKERIMSLNKMIDEAVNPHAQMKTDLDSFLEKRLEVEKDLAVAKARVDENEHQQRRLEQERNQIQQLLNTLREQMMQKRLKSEGASVKRDALVELLVEAKFDLQTVLQLLPEELTESECEAALERIANRIQRLGPINLAAVDEYKQQSERKVYLDSQNDDLVKALNTLENAIRKIDKETRTRFKETFDKINAGLQRLFPKVFGGGHAYLEMTGDDLLDTGVAIMARPPGKRNSTIHLLSGGEKAMTAIALVFSIFELNPSPFCMLDEVDAPLDDANVGRYASLVKEMSKKVQFIFITHNKITMEMANQLLGVTMHEPGVSRIVAVDIDEAAEMAAM